VRPPLLQAFPFPSTLGEVTLHQLSQASVFIYSSHGKWVFPPLLWSFPPTATFTSFPAPDCWAIAAAPAFSGRLVYLQLMWERAFAPLLLSFAPTTTFTSFHAPGCWVSAAAPAFCGRLAYLQFHEGFPLPPSELKVPHPLCYVCFLLLLLIIPFFSPAWGSVCPGDYVDLTQGCLWEYTVCLGHFVVHVFPSGLGACVWQWHRSPPDFSI
jgi:hypothetical protein